MDFTNSSKPKKGKQSTNYIWRRVSVLVDDGKEYIGKDPTSDQWITRFEDDSEDKSANPATEADYTLIK